MTVRITPEAEGDLAAVADFISRDNPQRAVSFVRELRSKCLILADFPRAYPLLPRYEQRGIRRRSHRDYLILYRVTGDHVDVLRIVHGRRDLDAILFPD